MRYIIRTIIGVLLLSPAAAQAQYEYYGHPGYGYYGGYYGYGGHASTVEEGYGRGVADVIRSQGLYNQLTADAAVRLEEARLRRIELYKQAVDTYFQVREQNKSRRAAERAERHYKTLRRLQQRQPTQIPRLSDTQLDPSTGELNWPAVLRDDAFIHQRTILDGLFAKRAREGGLYSIDDRQAVETATDELLQELRQRIKDIHPQDSILARRFIEALGNEVFYPRS